MPVIASSLLALPLLGCTVVAGWATWHVGGSNRVVMGGATLMMGLLLAVIAADATAPLWR